MPREQFAPESIAPGARAWTVRSACSRAVEVLRSEGFRALWFKVLGETVYRRLLLFETVLDEPPAPAEARQLQFGFLSEDELEEYSRFRADQPPDAAARRFRRGDRCYVARAEGRIVAARWIATGVAEIEYLGRRIPLAEHTVYRYDTFTSPDDRGRGVIGAAGGRLARELWDEGARRIVGATLPENIASLRMFEKEGFRACGRIGFVKLGRRRRDFGRI